MYGDDEIMVRLKSLTLTVHTHCSHSLPGSLHLRRRKLVLVLALRILGEETDVALTERACLVRVRLVIRLGLG